MATLYDTTSDDAEMKQDFEHLAVLLSSCASSNAARKSVIGAFKKIFEKNGDAARACLANVVPNRRKQDEILKKIFEKNGDAARACLANVVPNRRKQDEILSHVGAKPSTNRSNLSFKARVAAQRRKSVIVRQMVNQLLSVVSLS